MTLLKKKKRNNILAFAIVLFLALGAGFMLLVYRIVLEPNLAIDEATHIFIATGSRFEDVQEVLAEKQLLKSHTTFNWLAQKKNYPGRIMPGRYRLHPGMGNNELINMLRAGKQDPVMVTFNNIRTKEQLAMNISRQIEADSASIIAVLSDTALLATLNMNPKTAVLLFIPNSYEFFWNTSASQLLERMHREFMRFWNADRLQKANLLNMSPSEVMILASIVQRETNKRDEVASIAGVYINRLKRNMLLQADPTVVFATGDFSLKRVLHRHLAIDSPYNTYKYPGLPPGPIGLPEPPVIDGVLNYEKHNYLFFCARDDFSGYHAFARTYAEHMVNARRYHQALNRSQNTR